MMGFPDETEEEIEATVQHSINCGVLIAFFNTVVISPRIELMEIAKSFYPNFDFNESKMENFHYHAPTPFYQRVTGLDIFKTQYMAYRRFYLNPKRILLILLRLPKNYSLVRFFLMLLITMNIFGLGKSVFKKY